MVYNFSAEIIWDNEIGQYIGIVPCLPGAHTQAPTLDDLQDNLQDVIRLCLQELTDEEARKVHHAATSWKSGLRPPIN